MSGRFITLEGIDGAGKSSHIETLADWLRSQGRRVDVTREPGGTALAESLRELVLHRSMDALTEALLVFAARRDHLVNRIEPALCADVDVICDRFTDATFAYQGAGRGFDLTLLAQLETWVQGQRQPDLTFWFDLSATTAARRRSAVRSPDRFESEDIEFFERVRNGYLRRLSSDPGRFERLDAEQYKESVWDQMSRALRSRQWN